MKLQTRLLFSILPVIVIAMIALGCVAYVQLRSTSENELLMQMKLLLDQMGRQTDAQLQTTQANARLFGSSNLIERYVREEDEAERFDLLQPALLKLFASYQRAYPDYREIRLVLPDGFEDSRLAAVELRNVTEEEFDSEWFRRANASAAADESFSSQIVRHPDIDKHKLLVTRPIWLVDSNRLADWNEPILRGYLSVTASLDHLMLSVRQATIGRSGSLLLLHRDGSVLASGTQDIAPSLTRQMIEQYSIAGAGLLKNYIELDEKPHVLEARWLHPDLLLVAMLPVADFGAISRRLAASVAGVTLIAISIVSTLLFLLLRSLVLQPVHALRNAANAIGDGEQHAMPNIRRSDELGDLADAFEHMNFKLSQSMDELQSSHNRIEQLAYRDALTQLPNRRLFMRLVAQAIEEATERQGALAVLFLDLDEFKKVNDSQGHEAGDRLLQEIARRLQACVRNVDIDSFTPANEDADRVPPVARIGGDEFIILLDSIDDCDDAANVATRIVEAVSRPIRLGELDFVVGTSIGIAQWPDQAADVDELIKCADMAMYEAKRQGKNTFRHYGSAMQDSLTQRLQLENDLRNTDSSDQMRLEFQPQYATADRALIGVEALLRWEHPGTGSIAPDVFVPIAEDIGLMAEIGRWVLFESCRQWVAWRDAGHQPGRMAVNVSQRQFQVCAFDQLVQQALEEADMDPTCLEIELTETCMMEAPRELVATLEKIRQLGVRVAMDDFGTGYSSLAVLTSLPIDSVKIDQSFIRGLQVDTQNDKVVSAILTLAHSLGLEIIAEGVETDAEMRLLTERHCDVVQGNLLSHPRSADDISAMLSAESRHNDPRPVTKKAS